MQQRFPSSQNNRLGSYFFGILKNRSHFFQWNIFKMRPQITKGTFEVTAFIDRNNIVRGLDFLMTSASENDLQYRDIEFFCALLLQNIVPITSPMQTSIQKMIKAFRHAHTSNHILSNCRICFALVFSLRESNICCTIS